MTINTEVIATYTWLWAIQYVYCGADCLHLEKDGLDKSDNIFQVDVIVSWPPELDFFPLKSFKG